MNFKHFTSKLPPSVIRRAFEISFEFSDLSKRDWYMELNQIILKLVDALG